MTTGIDKRIFVVGAPRSGTTLVQSLLASHDSLASFTESHFFSRHFKALPRLATALLVGDPSRRVREFLAENEVDADTVASSIAALTASRHALLPLPLQTVPVARALLAVLDRVGLARDRSAWVEKTPRHLHFVPFLDRLSPRPFPPQFVHVIRRGIDVTASLHIASQSWEVAYDLDTCVERWNRDVALSLRRLGSPCDHFVFYEELTERPEASLKRLLASLGLDWQPRILNRFGETASLLITPTETWKHNVGQTVRASAPSRPTLTERDRLHALEGLRTELYDRLYGASVGADGSPVSANESTDGR